MPITKKTEFVSALFDRIEGGKFALSLDMGENGVESFELSPSIVTVLREHILNAMILQQEVNTLGPVERDSLLIEIARGVITGQGCFQVMRPVEAVAPQLNGCFGAMARGES